jgi:DNA polymerase-4
VVSTACYIARTFGVRSAMPMFKALKACPRAVVVRPNMAKYVAVGREVRAMMLGLTPLVEPLSIDEAFLDLSGTARLHGASPAVTLARFAGQVERDIGISVSIGLSYCKFLAKVASDLDKPRGFSIIGRAEALDFLREKPISLIWGVGKVAEKQLAAKGFRTIGDLQNADKAEIWRRHGAEGGRLWNLAHGIDDRTVSPKRETKSISSETTFETDVADIDRLTATLYRLTEKVAGRLKANALATTSITLKLKTARFQILTRSVSGLPPTQLTDRIFAPAQTLLRQAAAQGSYRLIGVGAGGLRPGGEADRGDLMDLDVGREKAREAAVDKLRARFGHDAVVKGWLFKGDKNAGPSKSPSAPLRPLAGEGGRRSRTDEGS